MDRPQPAPSADARRFTRRWWVFALVAVAVFMSTLDGSIVNIALPVIMERFGVQMPTVKWVMVIYLLVVSSLLLVFGRLSDIRGRRGIYCHGFLIFALGSLLCGTAPGVGWLILARAVQGVGAAMLMACSPALLVDAFPAAERGKALGTMGTAVAAGLTTGPFLGGWILELLSWHYIFLINIPIGVISAAAAFRILRGGAGDFSRPEKFDLWGACGLVLVVASLVLAVSRGGQWGWSSSITWGLTLLAAGGAAWLWRHAQRAPHPIFEPDLLRLRLFFLPVVAAMTLFICLFAMMFLMPFYLIHPAGCSIGRAGLIMVIPFVFLFFAAPVAGRLYDRLGASRMLCTLGMLMLALALLCLAGLPPRAGLTAIGWRLGLAGLGTAVFVSPNNSVAMGAVPARFRGVASATIATARNLGMVMGVALASLVFNTVFSRQSGGHSFQTYRPEEASAFMAAFRFAMTGAGIIGLLGGALAFLRGSEDRLVDPDLGETSGRPGSS